MSRFLEATGNPQEIYEHPDKIYALLREREVKELKKYMEKVTICMGTSKASRFSALLSFITTYQHRRNSSEPESRSPFADVVARKKLPFSETENANDQKIFVAQDVLLIKENGEPIHKPNQDHKDFIKDELMALLNNDDGEIIELKLRVGLAVGTSQQRGVSFHNVISFIITPFSEQEIDAYINQMGLNELKQTNGACRWEMPPFINHVIEIAGVKKGEDGFSEALDNLAMAVMGVYPDYIYQILFAIDFLLAEDCQEGWINVGADPDCSVLENDLD